MKKSNIGWSISPTEEYINQAGFPATWVEWILYLEEEFNKIYRWDWTAYIEVSEAVDTNLSDLQVKTAYENNANTNEFNDAEKTKLGWAEEVANKWAINWYAPLDATQKVPSANLPSYVDDVLEYFDPASFPWTWETWKIYVSTSNNTAHRWTGTVYVEVSSNMSAADIKSLYESNLDTNAFTDALLAKVNSWLVNKLDWALAPTATDDSWSWFTAWSVWVDLITNKAYICVDATIIAAIWIEITQTWGWSPKNTFHYDNINKQFEKIAWIKVSDTLIAWTVVEWNMIYFYSTNVYQYDIDTETLTMISDATVWHNIHKIWDYVYHFNTTDNLCYRTDLNLAFPNKTQVNTVANDYAPWYTPQVDWTTLVWLNGTTRVFKTDLVSLPNQTQVTTFWIAWAPNFALSWGYIYYKDAWHLTFAYGITRTNLTWAVDNRQSATDVYWNNPYLYNWYIYFWTHSALSNHLYRIDVWWAMPNKAQVTDTQLVNIHFIWTEVFGSWNWDWNYYKYDLTTLITWATLVTWVSTNAVFDQADENIFLRSTDLKTIYKYNITWVSNVILTTTESNISSYRFTSDWAYMIVVLNSNELLYIDPILTNTPLIFLTYAWQSTFWRYVNWKMYFIWGSTYSDHFNKLVYVDIGDPKWFMLDDWVYKSVAIENNSQQIAIKTYCNLPLLTWFTLEIANLKQLTTIYTEWLSMDVCCNSFTDYSATATFLSDLSVWDAITFTHATETNINVIVSAVTSDTAFSFTWTEPWCCTSNWWIDALSENFVTIPNASLNWVTEIDLDTVLWTSTNDLYYKVSLTSTDSTKTPTVNIVEILK